MRVILGHGRRHALLPVLALLGCLAANSQTPELQTYSAEYTIPFAQIGAHPVPAIPANILQAIQGGALEVRHSAVYTASSKRLAVRTFLVAPGSPNPTPPAAQTMMHEAYEIGVDHVLWAPQTAVPPGSSGGNLVIVGRASPGSLSFVGDIVNKVVVHSIGFDNVTPMRFDNITTVVSGSHTMYAQQGTGTLTFGTGSGGGPGTDTGPTVVVTAGNNSTTANSEIELDASGSSSPQGGALTYSWKSLGPSAAIISPTTAKPRVQFGQGFGEYIFEVTVTDAEGRSNKGQVKIMYVGR